MLCSQLGLKAVAEFLLCRVHCFGMTTSYPWLETCHTFKIFLTYHTYTGQAREFGDLAGNMLGF